MHSPLPHLVPHRPTRPVLVVLVTCTAVGLMVLAMTLVSNGHVPVLAQGAENHLSVIPALGDGSGEAQRTSGTAMPQQNDPTQDKSETPSIRTEGSGDGSTTRAICRSNRQFRDAHDNSRFTVEISAGSRIVREGALDGDDDPVMAVFEFTSDTLAPKGGLTFGTEADCQGNYVNNMIPPRFTIMEGQTTGTLKVQIDNDNRIEPDGYIDIQLGGTITVGRNGRATVWILDNDPETPISGLAMDAPTINPMDEALEVRWDPYDGNGPPLPSIGCSPKLRTTTIGQSPLGE